MVTLLDIFSTEVTLFVAEATSNFLFSISDSTLFSFNPNEFLESPIIEFSVNIFTFSNALFVNVFLFKERPFEKDGFEITFVA